MDLHDDRLNRIDQPHKLRLLLAALVDEGSATLTSHLLLTIVLFMLIPSLLITVFSNRYLAIKFQENQDQYLQATLAIALSEMQQRQLDIRKAAGVLVGETDTQRALAAGNTRSLEQKIALLQNQFDKVDYAVILDRENHIVARSSANLRYKEDGDLAAISRMAQDGKKALSSNETMPLTDLFGEGSEDYRKFAARLEQSMRGRTGPLPQALCEVTAVPILRNAGSHDCLGSLVLVGISNSDYYFPDYIASRATDGFLVLTVDGVHVSTKSTVGEDQSGIIGTTSQRLSAEYRGQDGRYGGRLVMDGVPYVFADQPLKNRNGEVVGYISFGLPEARFSDIVSDSRNLSLILAAVCVLCFAPLVWLVHTRLQRDRAALELQVKLRTRELESTVRELQDLNQTKTEFLSNMSHELRTPLSVIINACDFLKGGYGGPLTEKQLRYINDASECGSHLLTLINDLLDMTRLNAGRKQFHPMRMPLAELVRGCVYEMRSFRPDGNISLECFFDPADFAVYADPQLLRQILYNLLSNAIKFSPAGGRVQVFCKENREAGMAHITVRDEGIGIAPENLERIFREFEQIDNPLTKQYPGTGLGLPIVKKMVELHGGRVTVKSEPGKGSAFTFSLPLEAPEKQPDELPQS